MSLWVRKYLVLRVLLDSRFGQFQLIVLNDGVGQQFFTHSCNSLLRRVSGVFFESQVNQFTGSDFADRLESHSL